jgi:hypothetical protein
LSDVVLALLVIETVLLAREKYEVDKVLEVDDKVKELKKTHVLLS